ncbi:2-oxo acid dehydrogenase subunit E2 [Nonomuraea sp. NPDC050556]|uniref:dihydrolipoamide acetyltransferase family protein n=1 Tax=Nonomuraea sp. NPDC050556 TaxID=3364369 RepID=UPI00378F6463
MRREFKLPDVGEGLTEAEIVRWHVKPGDAVKVNQIVVEIETAKSIVELPIPWEGVIADLMAEEGQTIDVGLPIISVDTGEPTPEDLVPNPPAEGAVEPGAHGSPAPKEERQAVLVGYGVKTGATKRRQRKPTAPPKTPPSGTTPGTTPGRPTPGSTPPAGPTPATTGATPPSGTSPGTTPPNAPPSSGATPGGAAPGSVPPGGAGTSGATPGAAPLGGVTPGAASSGAATPGAATSGAGMHGAATPGGAASGGVVSSAGSARGGTAELGATRTDPSQADVTVLAKPPVRKLAKDLGVDLKTLTGTGPQGSITREDIHAAVEGASGAEAADGESVAVGAGWEATAGSAAGQAGAVTAGSVAGRAGAVAAGSAVPGTEERIPVKGVRKMMAQAMVASAYSAPHVTEFLQLDVTKTMEAVKHLKTLDDFQDVKVSPLLLVARAVITAIKRYPMMNSQWQEDEIVIKHYVNLGIAAATPRGLVVPNVKNAHALSLRELAQAFGDLTDTARAGRTQPHEMSGGTFTITNVGVFGVDTGTPIINPGESAILAFGQVRDAPWVVDGQLAVRKVTTLSLSFDHRVIDGELGSLFLRDVGAMLEDPLRMIAWS